MILGWGAVAMGHGHTKALFLIVTSRVMQSGDWSITYDQMGFLKKQNFFNDFLVVNELTNFQLELICVISLNTQDSHNFFLMCYEIVENYKLSKFCVQEVQVKKKHDDQNIGRTLNKTW